MLTSRNRLSGPQERNGCANRQRARMRPRLLVLGAWAFVLSGPPFVTCLGIFMRRVLGLGALLFVLVHPYSASANVYEIPLFLSVDNNGNGQGLLRIQGAYPKFTPQQRIQIEGYDDTGALHGPVWLKVDNFEAVSLTSTDLEQGNADKGLPEGIGDGSGNWRLIITADDDFLDVRAYARNLWGFGTTAPLYELATSQDILPGHPIPVHFVSMIHPRSNPFQTSLVRIFNRKNHFVRVEFSTPAWGAYGWCDIAPQAALQLDSHELADLIDDEFLSSDNFLVDAWALTVRVLSEPANPVANGHCENGYISDGAEPGAVDDIGVLSLTRDVYGNLVSDSGPPTLVVAPDRAPRDSTGQFDITVEFGEGFNEEWRQAILHSVARWEQVITADYPSSNASLAGCGIAHEVSVDDLLIHFEWQARTGEIGGAAQVCGTVATPGFPAERPNAGVVQMNSTRYDTQRITDFIEVDRVVLHEVGHVLGIGTIWRDSGYVTQVGAQMQFTGPNAVNAFRQRYPESTGVPLESDSYHWGDAVRDELMRAGGNRAQNNKITEVSIGALHDLGYSVSYEQAD